MVDRAHILVVDDDPGILELIADALEADYEVTAINDSRRALDLLHRRPPDLAILDLGMPQLDGVELTRLIRSDPSLHNTPILLISAYTNLKRLIPDDSVEGYLAKPFKMDALFQTIKDILGRAASRRPNSSPAPIPEA